MKKPVSIIIRIIIGITALAGLVWANMGTRLLNTVSVIGTVVFGAVIAVCVFWKQFKALVSKIWKKRVGKVFLVFFGSAASCCVVLAAVFSVNMVRYIDVPVENVNAVILLGCKVSGDTPSYMLECRLNSALEVLNSHNDAVCIVSGGQGADENITEAEAMRRYLTAHGIPDSRIIPEPNSSNTRENLRLSANILRERGITDGILIVTHDFHQYRAEIYARQNDLKVGHYSTKTDPRHLFFYWIREWAGIAAAYTGLF